MRAQVVQEARYLHRNGRSEMTVRLHPPELGRMKVDVQMRDGRLEVRIRVENAEVRETLRSELTGLDRSLRDAQLDLARLEVSDYQAGSQERRDGLLNEWEAPGRGMQPSQSGADAAGPAGWAVFSESGGVDCLV
ncbi:MAG: hypothetical protein AMK73_04695 [Planctomycetes bacterium SM23_32]|nr:MAG: hypothetical protein AMK73_04695 [Planctomycetes bacterium SM23_32]